MSDISRKLWQEKNAEKISQQHKDHYLKNKDEHKARMKSWRKNNPEKAKEVIKNWEDNNKEKHKAYHKKYDKKQKPIWFKNKYDTDIEFRILSNLRVRISGLLTGRERSDNTKNFLGIVLDEFILYIESQFKPEMNWSNYGIIWEIDHIIPCSKFDLGKEEDQRKCFHYTNLRPLFKTTEIAHNFGYLFEIGNRNKSNKLI